MKDYYRILNIKPSATLEELKKRYKELALKFHPDVSEHSNAHQLFLEINEAYQVLSDYHKRQYYDYVYNKYQYVKAQHLRKEQMYRHNLQKYKQKSRQKTEKKADVKYKEYIKSLDCFFNKKYKADGSPFNYSMHKIINMKGSIGATGTIKTKLVNIPIPRSKNSMKIHRVGFSIKFFFLILTVIFFFLKVFTVLSIYQKFSISLSLICIGGLLTHSLYKLSDTKSKFIYARRYHLVQSYIKKGFKTGFHPIISIPPFNLIALLLRVLL